MFKRLFQGMLFASLAVLATAQMTPAQMSIDDIEAALGKGTDELTRVDAILADPDQNRRIAGIQLLLASGNPLYVKRAKEAGLLSSDPDMQLAALKATLDAGGGIQLVFDLGGLPADGLKAWQAAIADYGSLSTDGKTGTITYDLRGHNEEENCYVSHTRYCLLRLTGSDVALLMGNTNFQGMAALDGAGNLAGSMSYRRSDIAVPVTIPLLD